jgi:hypothetical protein
VPGFRNAFHFPEFADPDEAGRFPGGQSGVKVLAFILGDEPIFTFSFQKFSVFQFLLLTWLEFFWNSLGTFCVPFCDTGIAGKRKFPWSCMKTIGFSHEKQGNFSTDALWHRP